MSDNVAAKVTIKAANLMTKKGRRAIADWLRDQADALVEFGDQYATKYEARYLYADKPNAKKETS